MIVFSYSSDHKCFVDYYDWIFLIITGLFHLAMIDLLSYYICFVLSLLVSLFNQIELIIEESKKNKNKSK